MRVLLFLVLTVGLSRIALGFEVVELGIPPGDLRAIPEFISADGSIIAGYSCFDYCPGFVWTNQTGFKRLLLPGDVDGIVRGLYGHTVLAQSCDDTSEFCRALAWTPQGDLQALTVSGRPTSYLLDWSYEGSWVTGRACDLYSNACEGYVWTPGNGVVPLAMDYPLRATPDGSKVVGYSCGNGPCQATVWSRATNDYQYLGIASGFARSNATQVSNDGSVVVGYQCPNIDGDAGCKTFVWTAALGIHFIGLEGELSGGPNGMSADGRLVAGSSFFANYSSQAFTWSLESETVGLPIPAGFAGTFVTDVGQNGRAVRGYAILSSSNYVPFVWSSLTGMQLIYLAGQTYSNAQGGPWDGNFDLGYSCALTSCRTLLWTESGGINVIEPLSGDVGSSPVRSNADGSEVLISSCGQLCTLAIWTPQHGTQALPVTGGVVNVVATPDIQHVAATICNSACDAAEYWSSTDGRVVLPQLSGGPGTTVPRAISDDGSVIAGASCAVYQSSCVVVLWKRQSLLANQAETNSGTNVAVTSVVQLPNTSATTTVSAQFASVAGSGITTAVAMSTPGGGAAASPANFKAGTPPVYYDVSTTATFSGNVTLCFFWEQGQFHNENNIKLFHYENGAWLDVTSSLDTTANRVCGVVTSLSPFALFETAYSFNGFLQPVDNPPVRNTAKAGSSIPVKFSLNGDRGLNIFDPGFPQSQPMSCTNGAASSEIEETSTAGTSSLSYDASTDQYRYVWKTDKAWAGTCRRLVLQLNDGARYTADFGFAK